MDKQTNKISRISRLREYRSFRDFTWPSDLDEFGQFNLIYGWNGSGKSTISSLFQALELRQLLTGINAKLKIAGRDYAISDITEGLLY